MHLKIKNCGSIMSNGGAFHALGATIFDAMLHLTAGCVASPRRRPSSDDLNSSIKEKSLKSCTGFNVCMHDIIMQ